jgi:hypothetical protein
LALAFAYATFQAGRKSGTTGAPTGGGLSGVVAGNCPGIGFSEGTGNGEKPDWALVVSIEVIALADALGIEMDPALTEPELVEPALERGPAVELESETTVLAGPTPEDDATLLTAAEPLA